MLGHCRARARGQPEGRGRGRGAAPTPSTTFSATVITGISMKCWCTMPIPASIAFRGELILTGFPSIRISPASGW